MSIKSGAVQRLNLHQPTINTHIDQFVYHRLHPSTTMAPSTFSMLALLACSGIVFALPTPNAEVDTQASTNGKPTHLIPHNFTDNGNYNQSSMAISMSESAPTPTTSNLQPQRTFLANEPMLLRRFLTTTSTLESAPTPTTSKLQPQRTFLANDPMLLKHSSAATSMSNRALTRMTLRLLAPKTC
jgi:hypothetical protein